MAVEDIIFHNNTKYYSRKKYRALQREKEDLDLLLTQACILVARCNIRMDSKSVFLEKPEVKKILGRENE